MNRFAYGPGEKLIPGHVKLPPRTAPDLLHDLDVINADHSVQLEAVLRWLESNKTVDMLLLVSLERYGLINAQPPMPRPPSERDKPR